MLDSEWIYLSDEMILEYLTNETNKDALRHFYDRILLAKYEKETDYIEVSARHELVKTHYINCTRKTSNRKKYYIITQKTYKSLLERSKYKIKHQNKEKQISDRIAIELTGKREVVINNCKRIDILTDKHIIEVKNDKKKFEAIGQILYYSVFCPGKMKRIHLFDWQEKDETYEQICDDLDIEVTYE